MATACGDELRRHGDVFPLNPVSIYERAVDMGVSSPQRAYWISKDLSKLAMHGGKNSMSSVLRSNLPLTYVQQATADRICDSLLLHGDCPHDTDAESALRSLRGGIPSYDGVPSNLASYDPEKLKILRQSTAPQPVVNFLPSEAKALVNSYDRTILREDPLPVDDFRPYWDPALRFDGGERLAFIVRMFQSGLITLRAKPASFVGVFFVKKKSADQIRMVIDCRGTNRMCSDPPVTRLGSSRCLAGLRMRKLGSDNCYGWGMEADVADCFYRFSFVQLAHYFAINHPLTKAEWSSLGIDVSTLYDPGSGDNVCYPSDAVLYPCFRVVPMGWNWALWLCNEAVLSIAQSNQPWIDGVLREKKEAPDFEAFKTILGVYVDNITILGTSRNDVAMRAACVRQAFDKAGIPLVWTHDHPVSSLDSVGCCLDLSRGIIYNRPKRVWQFFLASVALLRRSKLRAKCLEVWTGHYTSLCSLVPHGLAVLSSTYRFIQCAGDRRIKLWGSVRQGIKIAASMVWLSWVDLAAPVQTNVEVGDSATSGYAMMVAEVPSDMVEAACKTQERWRFIPMPETLKKAALEDDVEGFAAALEAMIQPPKTAGQPVDFDPAFKPAFLSTDYARHVVEALKDDSVLATSAIRSQVRARVKDRADLEVPALVQPLPHFFSDQENFRLLWCRRWRNPREHISLKEARVLLSSLKRASRVRSLHGTLKLSVSDNLPAVCAFSKGRSSNFRVNVLCRQAAAYAFATGIQWHVRHVETKRNVADEPSRRFERAKRRPFKLVHNDDGLCGGGLSNEASAPSKPLCPHRPDDVFPSGQSRCFLEVFSGTGRLTAAVDQAGLPALDGLDYLNGPEFDLRRRRTQKLVLQWLRKGFIGFLHLGTPCTIWSRARHNVKNSARTRIKEETGVEMALFSSELIETCIDYGIPYALENPRSSRLFHFQPILQAISRGPHYVVDFDMCMYGEPYMKRTRLVTSEKWLRALGRTCNHSSHDVRLKGRVKISGDDGRPVYVNRTALAGAYPFQLVRRYADLIRQHVKLDSKDHKAISLHWRASLRSVAERGTKKSCRDKVNCDRIGEQQFELELLKSRGGLTTFFDAIALGRDKKEAWLYLQGAQGSQG
eukprot:Skav232689  [mRNA]  locus=scaffold2892:36534:39881:+ [translate_table: standard]